MCARVCGTTRTNSTTHSRPSLSHSLDVPSRSLAHSLSPVFLSGMFPNERQWFLCVSEPRVAGARAPRRIDQIVRPMSMSRKDNNTAYRRRSLLFWQCWQTGIAPELPKTARRIIPRVLFYGSWGIIHYLRRRWHDLHYNHDLHTPRPRSLLTTAAHFSDHSDLPSVLLLFLLMLLLWPATE